ncbi:hypothetical protein IGI04_000836 [Brassica rapa subsp. trilocularis]|uniref:Uncharacterized protein n=1 Tax=Brassica rapa subsp. trilocularis TaxID=1813537 RepID=A0ABQ7NQW8_BRACM|nr:hypothetical protein IGI04_000836 [Brassica rapa subsp. trilocularis]
MNDSRNPSGITFAEAIEPLKCILKHLSFYSDRYPYPVLQSQSHSFKTKIRCLPGSKTRFSSLASFIQKSISSSMSSIKGSSSFACSIFNVKNHPN